MVLFGTTVADQQGSTRQQCPTIPLERGKPIRWVLGFALGADEFGQTTSVWNVTPGAPRLRRALPNSPIICSRNLTRTFHVLLGTGMRCLQLGIRTIKDARSGRSHWRSSLTTYSLVLRTRTLQRAESLWRNRVQYARLSRRLPF